MKKIIEKILKHKIIYGFIFLLIIFGGWFGVKTYLNGKIETTYILAPVEKGTIVTTITGSGQVAASNQLAINPKVSGDVIGVYVKTGQDVKKGDLLVQLDNSTALKAVRDAQINLESAKISVAQGDSTEKTAEQNLLKAYDQGFNEITSSFVDFSTITNGLKDILFSESLVTSTWNLDVFRQYGDSQNFNSPISESIYYIDYQKAKTAYEKNLANYKLTDRSSTPETIQALIKETYNTTKSLADSIKETTDLIQLYRKNLLNQSITPSTLVDSYLSDLSSYNNTINSHLINLFTYNQTIENKAGADPLGMESKQLSLTQKENAVLDARETLADYSIRAPFDGVVAAVAVNVGDSASSGTSVVTIITKQQTVEISLNEVDVAKVKTGQKATLTFDAIEDLTMTGQVAEVDTLGTVSQGVVSYKTKIVFDTQNENVKPSMSVSASIATNIKQNTLMVPVSAIKSQGTNVYVETLENIPDTKKTEAITTGTTSETLPVQKAVQIGISDDSYTEILSGLKEGDLVIVKTTTSSKKTTSTAPSLFQTGNTKNSTNTRNSAPTGIPRD